LRYTSAGQGEIHEPSGLNIFNACSIIDWGDIEFDESERNRSRDIEQIAKTYKNFAQRGISTFSVGGEHISTYGVLKGLTLDGERPVALIQLDAHHNTSGDRHGPRLTDGGFFRLATVKGLIDPEKSTQARLRGQGLTGLEFSKQTGMNTVTARTFQARGAQSIAAEVRELVGDMPCYLTIDTSVLDCGVLPGTRLSVPFGLSPREVRDFLDGLCGINLVGADLMELSPQYDTVCISTAIASGIGFELLGLLSQATVTRRKREIASAIGNPGPFASWQTA
jgi:arginase family enzyme